MHRTCGTGVIKDDLLFIADFSGLFHCLDAKTGKVHWTYDMLAASWASPLIVDGKVYIGDEDGDICVFELSAEQKLLSEINMGSSVYSTPVVANNVLFIANKDHVFAIEKTRLSRSRTHVEASFERRPVQRRSCGTVGDCSSRSFGAEVVPADTAADALAALGHEKFDLVMVNRKLDADYSDGIEIIRQIKADPQVGRHALHAGDQLSRAPASGRCRRRRARLRQAGLRPAGNPRAAGAVSG